MFLNILRRIFGSRNDRLLKKYSGLLDKINNLGSFFKKLSDYDLKQEFFSLRSDYKNNSISDKPLVLVYALVREVAFRKLKMRHYDVQILGGIALFYGKITEIATGEGKTLVATLPVCLYSLFKKSIHVITVNDYLARRDAEWMRPVYNFLDISVGVILPGMSTSDRKNSYKTDVVYGASNEFGFDYLRDNIIVSADEKVQDFLFYAIIDEVDSVLIDEARTPLIISLPSAIDFKLYILIRELIKELDIYDFSTNSGDFTLDEKNKQVQFTDYGFIKLESLFRRFNVIDKSLSLYDVRNIELLHSVYAALKAQFFFKKDIDYLVKNGNILIIDEHTGRVMSDRRWGDGIHQAIEAKESVFIKSENQTLASITFQNYFRLYSKLSGMTGTAYTEANEFRNIYKLEVIVIPTNKANIRKDYCDLIFLTKKSKFKAIVDDIRECYFFGQPVLIGTTSIEISEFLSMVLGILKIKHNVLNAKYHDMESQIISEAGRIKSVTVATNMAGRGTDIVLGGSLNTKFRRYIDVVKLGGLRVIGTERHESRRIDNQLRGRSGRQGDPGCSQFYLSLEDDLVRIFVGDKISGILGRLKVSDADVISHSFINKSIESAQRRVEGHNFDTRKQLLEFDDIINEQRVVFYEYRNSLIFKNNIILIILDVFKNVVNTFLSKVCFQTKDLYKVTSIVKLFNLEFGFKIFIKDKYLNVDSLKKIFLKTFLDNYKEKQEISENRINLLSKLLFLNILDVKWREHLINLDHLKKGIHLRGYAQKDPKQEYKIEAFSLFENMLNDINYEFVILFLKLSVDNITNGI